MAVTLNLNPKSCEPIVLDPKSEIWLKVVRNNTKNQRPCAVPEQYFDVLKTWGFVQGTPGSAKISPTGLARLLTEEHETKEPKKQAKKKKK